MRDSCLICYFLSTFLIVPFIPGSALFTHLWCGCCRARPQGGLKFVYQELDYINKNQVSKKWQLVNDFTDYLYSSASYYEKGIKQYDKLLRVNEVLL